MKKRQALQAKAAAQPITQQLQLVDIPRAAELLNVGRTTIYNMITDGELKTVKVRGARRIALTTIQAYIEANTQAS